MKMYKKIKQYNKEEGRHRRRRGRRRRGRGRGRERDRKAERKGGGKRQAIDIKELHFP